MSYKLGSLFDGSGGFPLAGALCGIEPVWASEVEPYPIAVTKSRFPKLKHLGDISKINGGEIEPVDIITFGSPCQDLSVAGKRAGLKHEANGDEETTRSGLFMEAVRIIKEMRNATDGKYPTFALWENVPGAFSSNKGEDFKVVLEELIKIVEPSATMPGVPQKGWNYADSYIGDGWSLAYRVLDAQYWGVPQRRRRIYLVTDFRGQRAREILFEREGLRGYFTQGRTPWQTTPTDAQGSTGADDREGETPYTLKIRSGCDGGGKGALIQKDKSATLATNNDQYLFQPTGRNGVIAIDKESFTSGVGFDRAPGIKIGGPCATLQTNGVHAVCYDARGNGDGLKSNTITGDHENRVTDYTSVVVEEQSNFIDVEMEVAVRKYEVNASKLVEVLRAHKGSMTNKAIAEALNCPVTQVEHWFRTDRCFAIPDPDVWVKLKELLGISTTEFDQSIMTFEYKGGNYDMRNRIHTGETAPTLTCGSGNTLHLLPSDPIICLQGNGIDRADNAGCNGKGWKEDTSYTLNTIDRPAVVYNSSKASFFTRASKDGPADTLVATDYKDPQLIAYGIGIQSSQGIDKIGEDLSPTLINGSNPGWQNGVMTTKPQYIVRRLTPTECARLQGFADRWGDIDAVDKFSQKDYQFWLEVRKTYDAINGREPKAYTVKQMLTWYNKLQTDSAEYKMWGNGIALPTALYVLQGVEDALFITEMLGE